MKINIARNQLNENIVRIVALLVVIVTLVALAYNWIFLAVILIVDFALRSFTRVTSPLAYIAKTESRYLKLKPNREEVNSFKENLIQMLDRINDTESEEYHKNLITYFL